VINKKLKVVEVTKDEVVKMPKAKVEKKVSKKK